MFRFKLALPICLGIFQLILTPTILTPIAAANSDCQAEEANLMNESAPARTDREVRSATHFFKLQIPENYRAIAGNNLILVLSPEAYAYHQCQPPVSRFYTAAEILIKESKMHPSASLSQAFDVLREEWFSNIQGGIQETSVAGQPALKFYSEVGGDGLTLNYALFSPQRTKLIIISSWVESITDSESEILDRIIRGFQLQFSITQTSPRVGIVPSLDMCGLAVWQRAGDQLTHLLTAQGDESWASVRIDDQLLRLRSESGRVLPGQTRAPGVFSFQNADRSITATLQGRWQIGWQTSNATLRITRGSRVTELPVSAHLGCDFAFY